VDDLFQVGEKVVYPMHGAGVIEDIEEKEVLGEKHQYYVIRISIDNLKAMVPMEKASSLHIRSIVDTLTMKKGIACMERNI
jgi:CarD family transcriptional regulator